MTNTHAYTEIDGLDDGRSMFAIVSFEGVLNFTAEGRLYYRIGAHLSRICTETHCSTSTAPCHVRYLRRLSGNPMDDFDD